MKVNIFVPTRSGGKFTDYAFVHSSITGEDVNGPAAFEDALINEIDESRMSDKKLLATKFLSFLANRRLTMDQLKQLSPEEQVNIKKEFVQS